jgi:hypothetical protein
MGRELEATELREELEAYAKVIKPYDWVLELFVPLELVKSLDDVILELAVKVLHPPLRLAYAT